jgi:CheY-like chemotaxis protein
MNILVVDDDRDILSTIGDMIKFNGCEAVLINSPEEALRMVRHGLAGPDAVISDQNTGSGMKGIELIQALRTDNPKLRCAIMSGEAGLDVPKGVAFLMKGSFGWTSIAQALAIDRLRIRYRWKLLGGHVHIEIFAGIESRDATLGKAGEFILREEEFNKFVAGNHFSEFIKVRP